MRFFLLLLAMLLGCTTTPAGDAGGELRDREWSMVRIGEFDAVPAGVTRPTIRFGSDGRLSGNTGCNQAGANYTVEGSTLTIDAVISTKRACIEPQGNALEFAYLQAIEATRSYRIVSGELELLDAAGTIVARFR